VAASFLAVAGKDSSGDGRTPDSFGGRKSDQAEFDKSGHRLSTFIWATTTAKIFAQMIAKTILSDC